MASAINPLSSQTDPGATTSTQGVASKPPSEQMFLQLLVAQIKNQDPLNPTDGAQFAAQLAQFSELEQVIAIRGDIEKGQSTPALTGPATTPGTSSNPGTTHSTTPGTASSSTTATQN